MLSITKTLEDERRVQFRLDGSVDGAALFTLEKTMAQCTDGADKTITLDFAGVVFIDDDAARRVAQLKGDGIRIVNGSLFIETLLRSTEG